jgi:hypothetical protein
MSRIYLADDTPDNLLYVAEDTDETLYDLLRVLLDAHEDDKSYAAAIRRVIDLDDEDEDDADDDDRPDNESEDPFRRSLWDRIFN